jgi:tetratricopeptide (TPR) repeat protein
MDPKAAPYYIARGEAFGQKNQLDRSIADFNQAITLDPTNASVFADRALAQAKLGAYGNAIADCENAIKLNGALGEAYNNLAWILATCPNSKYRDGKKALAAATEACKLSDWKVATSLDTFAAAAAQAGDFDAAVKWEQIAIAAPGLSASDIADAKKRLALFQAHKTYQETPEQSPAPFTP